MPQTTEQQVNALAAAINADGDLARLLAEVERLHRVVFHDSEHVDWSLVTRSAEQILIAEILSRHHGRPEGLRETLAAMQASGTPRSAALSSLATRVHSYYTTPLGIVMRQDLFGDSAVFITPDAYEWKDRQVGQRGPRGGRQP